MIAPCTPRNTIIQPKHSPRNLQFSTRGLTRANRHSCQGCMHGNLFLREGELFQVRKRRLRNLPSCMLLEVLIDDFSPLLTQNAQHLGPMEGLESLTGSDVINQLEHLRNHKPGLVFCWDEERDDHDFIFVLDAKASSKYLLSSELRSPLYPSGLGGPFGHFLFLFFSASVCMWSVCVHLGVLKYFALVCLCVPNCRDMAPKSGPQGINVNTSKRNNGASETKPNKKAKYGEAHVG